MQSDGIDIMYPLKAFQNNLGMTKLVLWISTAPLSSRLRFEIFQIIHSPPHSFERALWELIGT